MRTKLYYAWITVLLVACAALACTDDTKPAINGILKSQIDTLKSGLQYYYPYTVTDLGYQFTPASDGVITHLGLKTGTAGLYKVRVFDGTWSAFNNIVAQQEIDITVADKLTYERIDNLEVKKDQKYVIAVNLPVKSFFRRIPMTFPYNAGGGITIQHFAGAWYGTSTGDIYNLDKDGEGNAALYLAGIPDFVFVKK